MLERADVAALTADDPALQVVGRELDEGDRGLGGVARRDPLQGVGDEVAGAALRLGAGLLLELPHAARELVTDEVLPALEEMLLRLADGQARDPLELGELARARLLQVLLQLPRVGLAVGHPLLAPRELLDLRVDLRLAREHPLLELDDLASTLAQLLLQLLPEPELPLAGLDLRLALPRLHLLVGLGQERLPTTGGGGDRGSAPPAEDEDGGDRSDDETRDQRCRDEHGCSCLSSGAGGVPKSVEGRAASGPRDGPASHPQRCLVLVLEVAIVVVM